jgi:sulfur-oxidizing protein SoxY
MQRRDFLSLLSITIATLALPIKAFAATWNKAAFGASQLEEAIKNLGIKAETLSNEIEVIAPDRAENGAIVQIEIVSKIPNTEEISVLVEHNPTALIGHFVFKNGAMPYLVTRIKMAETSDIKVVVKVGERYFTASKNVVVLENGCG